MSDETWLAVMARISASNPTDLDQCVFGDKETAVVSKTASLGLAAEIDGLPPSSKLWKKADEAQSFIGIRVTERCTDCAQIAYRLAAAALERAVIPILITTLSDSGFENFGFRIERVVAGDAETLAVREQELAAFWNMALILDISDVDALG